MLVEVGLDFVGVGVDEEVVVYLDDGGEPLAGLLDHLLEVRAVPSHNALLKRELAGPQEVGHLVAPAAPYLGPNDDLHSDPVSSFDQRSVVQG